MPTRTASRAKSWCFTINNYSDGDIQRLSSLEDQVDYLIAGREIGEGGTPHLQGFVKFKTRVRLAGAIAIIGRAHMEVARMVSAAIEYCRKEDQNPIEVGELGARQGSRTDLELFKDAVKENPLITLKDVRELHSDVYSRCPRFCLEYLRDNGPEIEVPNHDYRPWQTDLLAKLEEDPDDRKITFVVDLEGNKGKTWFGRHLMTVRSDVQVLIPGKKADMAYAIDPLKRIYIMDAPRSKQGEFIQYDFLEEVKNGYIFVSKYESALVKMARCHLVVMMNEDPDYTKLSADRYDVINI